MQNNTAYSTTVQYAFVIYTMGFSIEIKRCIDVSYWFQKTDNIMLMNILVEKGVTEEVVKVLTKANSHKRLPKEQKKESENDNIHSEKAFGVQIQKIDEKKQKKFVIF